MVDWPLIDHGLTIDWPISTLNEHLLWLNINQQLISHTSTINKPFKRTINPYKSTISTIIHHESTMNQPPINRLIDQSSTIINLSLNWQAAPRTWRCLSHLTRTPWKVHGWCCHESSFHGFLQVMMLHLSNKKQAHIADPQMWCWCLWRKDPKSSNFVLFGQCQGWRWSATNPISTFRTRSGEWVKIKVSLQFFFSDMEVFPSMIIIWASSLKMANSRFISTTSSTAAVANSQDWSSTPSTWRNFQATATLGWSLDAGEPLAGRLDDDHPHIPWGAAPSWSGRALRLEET